MLLVTTAIGLGVNLFVPGAAPVQAQTIISGDKSSTVNVSGGETAIVGGARVSVSGLTNATNVTGGTLTVDPGFTGFPPAPIVITTRNGTGLLAAGGSTETVAGGGERTNLQSRPRSGTVSSLRAMQAG